VDANVHFGAITGKGLVDRIVDYLVDQMVKAIDAGRSDVHGRTFSNSLKPF
jgi:hypothetical protein